MHLGDSVARVDRHSEVQASEGKLRHLWLKFRVSGKVGTPPTAVMGTVRLSSVAGGVEFKA